MTESDADHKVLRKEVEGVVQLMTRVSHGKGEIGDSLAKLMAKQCCLTLHEFWELIDCPVSEEDWDKIVRERCPNGRNPYLPYG